MLEKKGSDWGANVRIIGVSIDQDTGSLVPHFDPKKWALIKHYHSHHGEQYGVKWTDPRCLLFDTTGKIVFDGHPASRNLDLDID